ncbi:MAG: methyltransferase domain-containing protein [Patescibacteria group bacterium]
MNLKNAQASWNNLADTDPLWAILQVPVKKGRLWKRAEFFATGKTEIDGVMEKINQLKFKLVYEKALDFGCGVGRMTQHLAHYFREVYGVDISAGMIGLAKKYNKQGARCHYLVNGIPD